MTWQEWFEYQNRLKFSWTATAQFNDYELTAEEMYQAFKARMTDEQKQRIMTDAVKPSDLTPEQVAKLVKETADKPTREALEASIKLLREFAKEKN